MAGCPHRTQDYVEVLAGVAKGCLPAGQILVRPDERLTERGAGDSVAQPAPVRTASCEIFLEPLVREQAAAARIDRDHLPGAQLPMLHRHALRNVDEPDLRRADDEPVRSGQVAKRAQTVAVESGADDLAVGEDDAGRAVPGLDQAGVIAIEVAQPLVELDRLFPGLRDEHRKRVRDLTAATYEQLESVVERARVGAGILDCRIERSVVRAPEVVLARAHPVDVSGESVDLAVVAKHAKRLRALPGRSRVGGEALVEDAERNLDLGIGEVGVEGVELLGGAERLVGDRAKGERRDVRVRARTLDSLARAQSRKLGLLVACARRRNEMSLDDRRRACSGALAEAQRLDRDVAPAGEADALLRAGTLDRRARGLVVHEHHRQAAVGGEHR